MRLIITAIFCLTLLININAQEVVSNSGNSFSNDNLNVSWTLGETIINTEQSTDKQLTQGFHQSKLVITAVKENIQADFSIIVFPNPTADYLNLTLEKIDANKLQFSLIDSNGKILSNTFPESNQTQIAMHQYPSGSYYLQVREKNNILKSFKIIKQ